MGWTVEAAAFRRLHNGTAVWGHRPTADANTCAAACAQRAWPAVHLAAPMAFGLLQRLALAAGLALAWLLQPDQLGTAGCTAASTLRVCGGWAMYYTLDCRHGLQPAQYGWRGALGWLCVVAEATGLPLPRPAVLGHTW